MASENFCTIYYKYNETEGKGGEKTEGETRETNKKGNRERRERETDRQRGEYINASLL